jgi:hypothetical protein
MEERARLMGGVLEVASKEQGGTRVILSVPLVTPDWVPSGPDVPQPLPAAPAPPPAAADTTTVVTRPVQ